MNSLLRRNTGRRRLSRRNHPAVVFACESVERRLLLASVGGTVYHDINANGQRDFFEGLQSGFRIYVDENGNGAFDEGERSTVSDVFGNWRIDGLHEGEHLIRQEPRAGFTVHPSTPPGGAYRIAVFSESSDLDGYDFGNHRYASLTGRVFFDNNGNGKDDGADVPLAGITVYVDANDNGILDPGELFKQTNDEGAYRIEFVRPGFNRIRVIAPAGLRASNQEDYGFVFASGFGARNIDFALTDVGEIHGRVFSDLNGNTLQDRDEPSISGRAVFLDYNNNGIRDAGEPATLTDANGDYSIRGLKPGRYRVQVARSNDTEVTRPLTNGYLIDLQPSQILEDRDFAMARRGGIRGVVFTDKNINGIQDDDERGIANRRVFLDINANGILDDGEPTTVTSASGEYRFGNLPSGRYFVNMVVPTGQFQTTPVLRHAVGVQAGKVFDDADLGVALQGYIAGTVFSDLNGNRAFEVDEPRLANRRVFLDANNNGTWDAGEISTMTDDLGQYVLGGLNPGQYVVRTTPIPGATLSRPASAAWTVNVAPGVVARNRDFGFSQFAMLSGNVYTDTNANGQREGGEAGRPNEQVYLDLNTNGVRDVGEPVATTDGIGAYFFTNVSPGVYQIRLETPVGYQISEPGPTFYSVFVSAGEARLDLDFGVYQTAGVSGVVYSDVNEDGSLDGGDGLLAGRRVFLDLNENGNWDVGEPSDITDAQGEYALTDIEPGDYRVAVVLNPDDTITEPVAGFYDISLAAGQFLTDQDFGLVVSGSISGIVWEDMNGDGVQDPGDDGLEAVHVYIDENTNGSFDPGEPSELTDATGAYTFSGLAVGSYEVRLNLAAGDTIIDPVGGVHIVAITSGLASSGNDFAVVQEITLGGMVYDDVDGNGTRDGGEPGLDDHIVYLDLNENGSFDGGEPQAVFDVTGEFTFPGILPGTYDVRIDALTITAPAAEFFDDVVITSGSSRTDLIFGIQP